MADAEGHAGDNIALLDLKDIEEGTVIELLRRRFSQGVIYVSELCKIHWNGDFLSWHVKSRIGNSTLCKFVKFALFSDSHWRHFSFSESFQATFDIWTWGKRAWSQIFILIFVWGYLREYRDDHSNTIIWLIVCLRLTTGQFVCEAS